MVACTSTGRQWPENATTLLGGTIRITLLTNYVTGTVAPKYDTHSNVSPYKETQWYPVHPVNRQQRRLLSRLPHNAIQLVEEVYGKRGEHHALAKWDQFFFKFWMRAMPKDHICRTMSRAYVHERHASPFRRFARGMRILRRA